MLIAKENPVVLLKTGPKDPSKEAHHVWWKCVAFGAAEAHLLYGPFIGTESAGEEQEQLQPQHGLAFCQMSGCGSVQQIITFIQLFQSICFACFLSEFHTNFGYLWVQCWATKPCLCVWVCMPLFVHMRMGFSSCVSNLRHRRLCMLPASFASWNSWNIPWKQ